MFFFYAICKRVHKKQGETYGKEANTQTCCQKNDGKESHMQMYSKKNMQKM